MDDITFGQLTKKGLYEGFLHCRKSAEEHRLCARLMAEKEIFGIANSHLILGAEEAIKAILMILRFSGTTLDISSIKPFFHKHGAKHKQGLKMMLDVAKVKGLPDLLIMASQLIKLAKSKATIDDAMKSLNSLLRPIGNMDQWWADANDKKNNGFYVGYNKGWQPTTIVTKEHYEESEAHTTYIFELLDLSWSLNANDLKYI